MRHFRVHGTHQTEARSPDMGKEVEKSWFRSILADTIQSKANAKTTDKIISLFNAILPSINNLSAKTEPAIPTTLHPMNWKQSKDHVQGIPDWYLGQPPQILQLPMENGSIFQLG